MHCISSERMGSSSKGRTLGRRCFSNRKKEIWESEGRETHEAYGAAQGEGDGTQNTPPECRGLIRHCRPDLVIVRAGLVLVFVCRRNALWARWEESRLVIGHRRWQPTPLARVLTVLVIPQGRNTIYLGINTPHQPAYPSAELFP